MAKTRRSRADDEDARMGIGEHLEELRSCIIRSLISLVVACVACIWPAKFLLGFIAGPVMLVLRRHGQPQSFLQTNPTETFLIYVKVVMIAGLIIASPYVIYQLWSFVAKGLYRSERAWVYQLVPWSVGLFLTGIAFMYTFVLLVALNFLVGFGEWLPLPQPTANPLQKMFLGPSDLILPTTQPTIAEAPQIPIFEFDPADVPTGRVWFNATENKLKLRGAGENEIFSVPLARDDLRSLVTTHFKIGEYLSFVLVMTIAFGLAFQMPLVVIFLARSGIVPLATMRKSRKIVILLIVFIAGMLAPPDLLSHILLSGPMVLLFEIGLLVAARSERAAREKDSA